MVSIEAACAHPVQAYRVRLCGSDVRGSSCDWGLFRIKTRDFEVFISHTRVSTKLQSKIKESESIEIKSVYIPFLCKGFI